MAEKAPTPAVSSNRKRKSVYERATAKKRRLPKEPKHESTSVWLFNVGVNLKIRKVFQVMQWSPFFCWTGKTTFLFDSTKRSVAWQWHLSPCTILVRSRASVNKQCASCSLEAWLLGEEGRTFLIVDFQNLAFATIIFNDSRPPL